MTTEIIIWFFILLTKALETNPSTFQCLCSHFHTALLMKPYTNPRAISVSVLSGAKTSKGSMHEMTQCTQRQKPKEGLIMEVGEKRNEEADDWGHCYIHAICFMVLGVFEAEGALQQVQLIEPESDQLFWDSPSFKLLVRAVFIFRNLWLMTQGNKSWREKTSAKKKGNVVTSQSCEGITWHGLLCLNFFFKWYSKCPWQSDTNNGVL